MKMNLKLNTWCLGLGADTTVVLYTNTHNGIDKLYYENNEFI